MWRVVFAARSGGLIPGGRTTEVMRLDVSDAPVLLLLLLSTRNCLITTLPARTGRRHGKPDLSLLITKTLHLNVAVDQQTLLLWEMPHYVVYLLMLNSQNSTKNTHYLSIKQFLCWFSRKLTTQYIFIYNSQIDLSISNFAKVTKRSRIKEA